MDLTKQNLETIASLRLHNVSAEQRVIADRQVGERFHVSNGTWWHRVRQFFYLPASFLLPLRPHVSPPSAWRALGGYYHVVPDGAPANGSIVTNEIADPGTFRLEMLKKNKNGARKVREIEKGLSVLSIRRVAALDDLLGEGRRILGGWEQRTIDVSPDVWHKGINTTNFQRWADLIFHHPYDLLLGAYFEKRLVGFARIKATDGVANLVNTFGDYSLYATQQVSPTTALNYAYIKICGQSPGIHKAVNGMRSLKESLERYKAELGYRHVRYPAFICLHPLARSLVRFLMPVQYRRLMGRYTVPDQNYERGETQV
jgi:hypothetical protein